MQIPALIKSLAQRMGDMIETQLPGAMDYLDVFAHLYAGEGVACLCFVGSDRHDIGRAVGQPNFRSSQGDLHYVASEVACWMVHGLMKRGDAAGSCIVVDSEVGSCAESVT